MIKECQKCRDRSGFKSGAYELQELSNWLESVDFYEGKGNNNSTNQRNALFRCKECGAFWEWRPLYEETMFGGEPGEWIKVSLEYVKEKSPVS